MNNASNMQKEIYDNYLISAFKGAAALMAKEMLNNIPEDDELKRQVTPPEGLFEEIMKVVDNKQTTRRKKRSAWRLLVAAIIVCLMSILTISLSVTAFRINILNAMLNINNNVFSYFTKISGNNDNSKILSIYNNLYNAKKDVKFNCLVPKYLPDGIQYKSFEILDNGKRLNIYFSGNGKTIKIYQYYITDNNTTGGSTLDTQNTDKYEYNIMGNKIQVFSIKSGSDNNIFLRWYMDNINVNVFSDLGISEVKKVVESMDRLK